MDNTSFFLVFLTIGSFFSALRIQSKIKKEIKRTYMNFIVAFILSSIVGITTVYLFNLTTKELDLFFNKWTGPLWLAVLLTFVWAIPFFTNSHRHARVFVAITLLFALGIGALLFEHTFVPLLIVLVSFLLGISTKWIYKNVRVKQQKSETY